jgi:hypothetical protein
MSLIPGANTSSVTAVTSSNGSGIQAITSFGITTLQSGLVAGTNVALVTVPNFGGVGLRIDATPAIAGVSSVSAGTGITVSGTSIDPVVNNNGVLSVTSGSGISIGGTANNPSVSNTGVLSVTNGTGITIAGTSQNPQVVNNGVVSVSSGSGISIGGTANNPSVSNTGVLSVNSQQGSVTLASSGGSVAITTPTAGTINLEALGGGGTLTGVTAGTGIQVSGGAPSPTVTNTGVLSLTAGNNMLVSSPSGNVILAAKVARPLFFSVAGVRGSFPINTGSYGNQPLTTLTSFGDLLAGDNEFIGVNTGTVIMDLTGYCLATVSGQNGSYNVYITKVGASLPGLFVQSIQPSFPQGSTQDVMFNLGLCSFSMVDFRNLYGTGASNAFININILNQNVNQVFPAGNAVNYIAWYYPDSTI